MLRLLMNARFNLIEGKAFLGRIVAKSSIKDQFRPLQIRKSEQLVLLSAINDHFVTKKHQRTFPFYQKEHKEEEQSVLNCFSRRDSFKIKKGNGSEKQNVLKSIISEKEKKAKQRLKSHFEEQNRMPKLHWAK